MMRMLDVGITGYRSVRAIRFPVGPLTVFVGVNGVGKTNLYRAIQMLQAAAAGTLARELASEGGMQSALWAGKRAANKPVRMKFSIGLGRTADDPAPMARDIAPTYSYEIEVGLPTPTAAALAGEPQVKEERLLDRHTRRVAVLLERRGPHATAQDDDEHRHEFGNDLLASEPALASLQDSGRFSGIDAVRRTLLAWRFYHDFRSDRSSPLRQSCLAVATPTLASDGSDLAAVFATLAYIRQDTHDLDRAIDDAFPGARLVVPSPERTASFGLVQPEYPKRVFDAGELSDGTLRYLALAGALLGYRLPAFIALNEPESSLHPELLDPLARMIVTASERTQIWVVTHSRRLANAIEHHGKVKPREVVKRNGETWLNGLSLGGEFTDDTNDEADDLIGEEPHQTKSSG
jgi:predicted ATPase